MKKTDNNQQTRPGNFAPLRYNSGLKKFDFEYQGLTYEIPEDEALRMAEFVVNSLKAPRTRPITDMTEEEGRELAKVLQWEISAFRAPGECKGDGVSISLFTYPGDSAVIKIFNDGRVEVSTDEINTGINIAKLTDFLRERGFEV